MTLENDPAPKGKLAEKRLGLKRLRYQATWSWYPYKNLQIEKFLEPPTLHICAGMSKLGDVRVDLFTKCDIQADMFHLPFPDRSFRTVFSDPPWHLPYNFRPKLLWELRRVTDFRLMLRAPWIPKIPRMHLTGVGIFRPRAFWANTDIYGVYEREPELSKFWENTDPTESLSDIRPTITETDILENNESDIV